MSALTKGQEGSAQKAKELASLPSESSESKRRLPVGAYVSSVHVDYESFDVGTGQVSPPVTRAASFTCFCFLTVYSSFMRGVDKTDSNKNCVLYNVQNKD